MKLSVYVQLMFLIKSSELVIERFKMTSIYFKMATILHVNTCLHVLKASGIMSYGYVAI